MIQYNKFIKSYSNSWSCLFLSLGIFAPLASFSEETDLELNTLVVTSTGEEKNKLDVAESIDVINREDLEQVSPSHPAEILNRSAGVHINNLGGEGHMTAIRQPIKTGAVYLFLEDGIPTRPTGFFNHNGLYEINLPQASKIEITKGPASALYGSDAIGGVINSITNPSPEEEEYSLNMEVGSHGWKRGLLSLGSPIGDNNGFRLDVNLTDSDGYRDHSAYNRESLTGRYDHELSSLVNLKVVASHSSIDQSGTSSLEEELYRHDPTFNHYQNDIGFREVSSTRFSSEFDIQLDNDRLLTVTPFYRDNEMTMMPSWMITYDPNLRNYEFQSYGVLTKLRQNILDGKGQWILGLDVDYTPSDYTEHGIEVASFTADNGETVYTDHSLQDKNYDYSADQTAFSPYVHIDWMVSDVMRLDLGLRYDHFSVDYENHLSDLDSGSHLRPSSQSIDYDHWSPKAGLVWYLSETKNVYFNYRHAFRAPGINQLFRAGSSQDTVSLEPVQSDSFEVGLRHQVSPNWYYELAAYHQIIEDDIVSIIDGSDRKTINAGETEHQGIELSVHGDLADEWKLLTALSYSQHEYKDFEYIFSCFPPACVPPVRETRNFSGFDVGKAPETLGNVALQYLPKHVPGALIEVEYEHVGEYYTDETNTKTYDGHDLINLRTHYMINATWDIGFRVMNVTDELYSTYTSNQVGRDDITYRPGLPRSYFLNLNVRW